MKNANLLSGTSRALVFALVLSGLVACAKEEKSAEKGRAASVPPAVKTVGDYFSIKVGEQTVRMQLAVRPDEMERGLMQRRDLGRDDGMLFVYDRSQQMSFWMRNTPTALDIGFFDAEGVLQEVYPLYPFDERAVQSRGDKLKFALEMNQGWFAQNSVKPGAKLDFKALAEAMKDRGFEPKRFGL